MGRPQCPAVLGPRCCDHGWDRNVPHLGVHFAWWTLDSGLCRSCRVWGGLWGSRCRGALGRFAEGGDVAWMRSRYGYEYSVDARADASVDARRGCAHTAQLHVCYAVFHVQTAWTGAFIRVPFYFCCCGVQGSFPGNRNIPAGRGRLYRLYIDYIIYEVNYIHMTQASGEDPGADRPAAGVPSHAHPSTSTVGTRWTPLAAGGVGTVVHLHPPPAWGPSPVPRFRARSAPKPALHGPKTGTEGRGQGDQHTPSVSPEQEPAAVPMRC